MNWLELATQFAPANPNRGVLLLNPPSRAHGTYTRFSPWLNEIRSFHRIVARRVHGCADAGNPGLSGEP